MHTHTQTRRARATSELPDPSRVALLCLHIYVYILLSINLRRFTRHSALCIYILHIYILTRVYISYNLNRCVGVAVVLDVTTLQIHCYCCCVACAARTRAVLRPFCCCCCCSLCQRVCDCVGVLTGTRTRTTGWPCVTGRDGRERAPERSCSII